MLFDPASFGKPNKVGSGDEKMDVTALEIPGVFVFSPKKFGDERGFFSETWRQSVFQHHIPGVELVQDNHSFSASTGVLRGLHFQTPPFDQGKLVRVVKGRVLDVIVDLRRGSPTYGHHISVDLSRDNWRQLWVPAGFAHGFITLEPDTEFLYRCTQYYSPQHDSGLRFDDPDLAIKWPLPADQLTLSEKDLNLPAFKDFVSPFTFGA